VIYWDYNSTSPLRPKVKERMKEAIELYYANASAGHAQGQATRRALEQARRTLAETFHCKASEIVFTASATEANLMTLWGHWLVRTKENPQNNKILVSPTEHGSVYENVKYIEEKTGAEVVYMPLKDGLINVEGVEKLLSQGGWAFCTLIAANNETGIIQPWQKIAELCQKQKLPFHTDLVQYCGRLAINLTDSKASTATLSFHKSGGPKGVGALYIRTGVQIEPVIRGGIQEKMRRAGTENLVSILGAEAFVQEIPELNRIYPEKVQPLRDQFEKELKACLPQIEIVGANCPRIANTSYIIFENVKSDALLVSLDLQDICVSTGSACSSGLLIPSRNLLAMGYNEEQAISAIRFSLGPTSKKDEPVKVVKAVQAAILRLAA